MKKLEEITNKVTVGLTPVQWRYILTNLPPSDVRTRIFEQLLDAIGDKYCGQLTSRKTNAEVAA